MKGNSKLSHLILLMIFLFVMVHSQSMEYRFQHINTQHGLISNETYSLLQDSRGYIWIATNCGLCRYDGYNFKTYQNDPLDSTSISSNYLYSYIFEDNNGFIWVGTLADGVNKYDRNKDIFKRYKNDPDNPHSISHNLVVNIYQDKNNVIWIATHGGGLNRYHPETETFTSYKQDPGNPQSRIDYILEMYEDKSGIFWVGTHNGLFQFDRKTENFIHFSPTPDRLDNFNNTGFTYMIEENNNDFWFCTGNGIYNYINETGDLFHHFHDPENPQSLSAYVVWEARNNTTDGGQSMWIATENGLNKLDKTTGEVLRFMNDPDNPFSLSHNDLSTLLIDKSGLLWITTFFKGLNILDLNATHFSYYDIKSINKQDQSSHTATAFLKDDNNNLWVGTEKGGLFKFNNNMQIIDQFLHDGDDQTNRSKNHILKIFQDSEQSIWVGTYFGVYIFDQKTKKFKNCKLILPKGVLNNSQIFDIIEDRYGDIWIGAGTGLYRYKKGNNLTNGLENIQFNPSTYYAVRALCEDTHGNIWVGTEGGSLYLLMPENRPSLTFINYVPEQNNPNSLSNNIVMTIHEDKKGSLWIGTNRGLNKFNPNKNNFSLYDANRGLGVDLIYHIESDKNENLWLTTQHGLIRYNPNKKTGAISKTFDLKDGIPFDDIYPFNFYYDKHGKIYIGGGLGTGYGFLGFLADSIKDNLHIPPIVITDFKVKNRSIVLDSSISEIKHIKLKYDQNFFSFEYAALDYKNPVKNQYAYKLEGLDEDWIYSGTRRFANYTGMSPGKYIFRVKGSNNDGYWNETGTSIAITIQTTPWKTWWAYLLYGLLILGIFYLIIRYYLKRQHLLHKLSLEQIQSEKLEEIDRMKSRFFANISHEFRTPLTLILGPLEKLQSKIADKDSAQDLNMMQRNANRLLNLINQLLNLSKLESGKMQLQAQEVNIVSFVNRCVQSFESLAKQKKIDLNINSAEDNIPLFVDIDKIEKILYNLLSNAFKFTGEGGKIEVSVTPLIPPSRGDKSKSQVSPLEGGRGVNISISDTGRGIPQEKLDNIFDRFYQIEDSFDKDQEGTGIGLALTKELVELHHGHITVESKLGHGTIFTLILPLGKGHLKPDEINDNDRKESMDPVSNSVKFIEPDPVDIIFDDDEVDDKKPLLLVVEDNIDLRSYIRSCLTENYRISEATDGEMGLKKATDKIPDLIISDVMMPKMDGYEFCRQLKTNECTNHIPVILLTAKAGMDNKLEGLETGADDFLTKPFNTEELQVRIRNLIQQRHNLRSQFVKEFNQSHGLQEKVELSMDKKFILKATKVVEEYLSDPDFSVEFFGKEMALSRSQLHRKLSALLDQSPTHFIKTIRLNHAAVLLAEKSANVAEIAYDVGFNNPSYFAECFKKQFGKLPSEYTE